MRIEGISADVDLAWLTDERHVTQQLERYFVPLATYEDKGRRHYTGRFFEWYLDRSDPTRFTDADMLAVQRLSVTVPTRAAYELVEDAGGSFRDRIAQSWEQIGDAGDIRELDEDAFRPGPLIDLYKRLTGLHGVGATTASKLMAAKFPAHIPIQDSKVTKYLGATGSWWRPMKELLSSPGVAEALGAATLPGPKVELLRRLDVVLWMRA